MQAQESRPEKEVEVEVEVVREVPREMSGEGDRETLVGVRNESDFAREEDE